MAKEGFGRAMSTCGDGCHQAIIRLNMGDQGANKDRFADVDWDTYGRRKEGVMRKHSAAKTMAWGNSSAAVVNSVLLPVSRVSRTRSRQMSTLDKRVEMDELTQFFAKENMAVHLGDDALDHGKQPDVCPICAWSLVSVYPVTVLPLGSHHDTRVTPSCLGGHSSRSSKVWTMRSIWGRKMGR